MLCRSSYVSLESKDWAPLFAKYRQWVGLAEDEVTVLATAPTAKGALAASAPNGGPSPILYRLPDTVDAVQMGDML